MPEQQSVLFVVFVGFFVVIGVCSLLVLLGFIKTADPQFSRWAITGFVGAVVSAVLGLFKILFLMPSAFYVVLVPPPDLPPPGPELESATLVYQVKEKRHKVEVTIDVGGWKAKLPHEAIDQAVWLQIQDKAGREWVLSPFYPNVSHQQMKPASGQPLADASTDDWPRGSGFLMAAEPSQEGVPPTASSPPPNVKFSNYARKTRTQYAGKTFYEWRVFVDVDEPKATLDSIREVQYLLHPTFPEPLQVARDPEKQFELRASGWGEFRIQVTVRFKDGREVKTSHDLDFSKPWPTDR